MKTYPKYKDSNIPWIGRIPKHWEVIKYKHIACIKSGDPISVYDLSENACYPVFGGGKLIGYVNKYNVSDVILIGRVGSCGSITNIREKSWATDNALVLETKKNKNYIYYILLASDLKSLIGTNAQPLITAGKILNYCIPYTFQKEEQHAIAAYLDRKCSAIDRVIEAESRIIEKLKKYRQSLITETVSHGLNPHAPMKASGIPWIGRIPEHWKTIRIKNVAYLKGRIGWQGLKSNEYQETGPYLITGTDFENGKINWETCVHITQERFEEAPEIHIKDNDLLITKDGTVGKVALALNCPKEVSLNSGVMLIRNTKDIKYESKYLFYILLSDVFWNWFNSNLNGNSTIVHLYQEMFYNFCFCFPPLSEQISIADFLDKKCSAIDSTISKKQQIIEKMTEYKKSLIYECVTGKLSI